MSWEAIIDQMKEWVLAQGYATEAWVTAKGYATEAWVTAKGYLTTSYVDRGDPAAEDYTAATLTKDGAWHELDLSAIVPAGAKAITFGLVVLTSTIDSAARFKRFGNLNDKAITGINTQVSNIAFVGDLTVAVNAARKISYFFSNVVWIITNITVKGWWL